MDPGFSNPEEVLTFRVAIPEAEVEDAAEVALAYEDMSRRLRAIPGVTSVGGSTSLTMDGYGGRRDQLWVEDFPVIPPQTPPVRRYKFITGDYFETMQNPIRREAGSGTERGMRWSSLRWPWRSCFSPDRD